ncbi:MAG: F0F1 ATP synthase subunit epsilon [Limnochordia bacterium]|nr:F0F1 ATP synthase subunit epsilon [Limnochordia bacterium]MDD4517375.1 F0F1 ATP synthase subunit epsilon [Limnochordia bacterium]
MTGNKLKVRVMTPERTLFDGEADMIIARTADGDVGILPGHAPLVTVLRPGVFHIKFPESEKRLAVHNGYLNVSHNVVTVLSETAEREDEIDVERARQARRRAEERLRRIQLEKIDAARAQVALERAISRLQAAGVE